MTRLPRAPGPDEYALLGLLSFGPRHGYDLAAEFAPAADLGQICHLGRSLLYAHLKRLEALDWVAGTTELQEQRPPRRVYSLTPAGEAELARWLDEPVQHIREIRLDFLIKLYFAGRRSNEDADRLLGRQMEACRDYRRELEDQLGRAVPGGLAALGLGSRLNAVAATLSWLEAQRQVEALESV